MPGSPSVVVVVSYYAGRSINSLIRLLDSMSMFPAGVPYDIRLVVNRDTTESVELPQRHRGVDVLHRPNAGYNIGAWEAGWRAGPSYDGYLFLQDECRVVQSNWVGAFVSRAAAPGVGLVGECLSPDWDAPWDGLAERFRSHDLPDHTIDGRPAERVACYLDFFRRCGISPGPKGDHLQSLVLYATQTTLDCIAGFPECRNYGEAIAAEIGISKRVQASGLSVVEVGPEPFFYIEHPQWLHRRRTNPVGM